MNHGGPASRLITKCRICGERADHAFTARVLKKHEAEFVVCEGCGFLQANDPFWLNEAYEEAIASADTGILTRNIKLSRIASALFFWLFPRNSQFLDLAGGYGILVRLMRDVGFDFHWSDPYCNNLVSRGFEHEPQMMYEAITAFEVLEHTVRPIEFLENALAMTAKGTILFSTETFDGPPPLPTEWWYYAFPEGQHIAFFQPKTLRKIAEMLGRNLYSNGSLHLLTDQHVNPLLFKLLSDRFWSWPFYIAARIGMTSRTIEDHAAIIRRKA